MTWFPIQCLLLLTLSTIVLCERETIKHEHDGQIKNILTAHSSAKDNDTQKDDTTGEIGLAVVQPEAYVANRNRKYGHFDNNRKFGHFDNDNKEGRRNNDTPKDDVSVKTGIDVDQARGYVFNVFNRRHEHYEHSRSLQHYHRRLQRLQQQRERNLVHRLQQQQSGVQHSQPQQPDQRQPEQLNEQQQQQQQHMKQHHQSIHQSTNHYNHHHDTYPKSHHNHNNPPAHGPPRSTPPSITPPPQDYKYPFLDPSLAWSERVQDLVGRLSIEEVQNQTSYIAVDGPVAGVPRLGVESYPYGVECLHGARFTNGTVFPQALAMAATFSKSLVHDIAEAASYEARAHWNVYRNITGKGRGDQRERREGGLGKHQTEFGLSCFSPVINIMRHPLWGRNQETYGECPYLSGELAYHYISGLQGDHPRYVRASAGCKHFDAHGGPENIPESRFSFNSKITQRDWRMTFLPQFQRCVDAGSYSFMCSYNAINGVPACANKKLLRDILRGEWGFTGYVVSDDMAIQGVIDKHHYAKNSVDAVTAAIKAGTNIELGGTVYLSQVDALKQGKLTEEEIRNNILPLFYTRMRLGEFDPREMNPYNKITPDVIQSAAHRELALKAAMSSIVLMKNIDDFLPIKNTRNKIAVVGPMADNYWEMSGDYSAPLLRRYTSTPREALAPFAPNNPVQYASGCLDNNTCTKYDEQSIANAVSSADLVVVCLGTGQLIESEGNDRANISLPGKQLALLQDAVKYSNAPVVLVLFNAGPLDITWAKESPDVVAILEAFFPGQSGGEALYHVMNMSGGIESVPAARLPATWPTSDDQVPPITNYTMAGRTYRYYRTDEAPLYPFGFGLSYSRFRYTSVRPSSSSIRQGQSISVSVTVENVGPYDAEEVVQLYMSWPSIPGIPVPRVQLVGFQRVPLLVNASAATTVTFTVTPEQTRVWIADNIGWRIITGLYTLYAGGQQPHQTTSAPSNVLSTHFKILNGLKNN